METKPGSTKTQAHRLFILISLPSMVLPSISITQPGVRNPQVLTETLLAVMYNFYYQLDPGLQLRL